MTTFPGYIKLRHGAVISQFGEERKRHNEGDDAAAAVITIEKKSGEAIGYRSNSAVEGTLSY